MGSRDCPRADPGGFARGVRRRHRPLDRDALAAFVGRLETATGAAEVDIDPLVVTEKGYIAEYNITSGNDGFTRQTIYDVSEFGNATVTRPAWMPEE